MSVSRIMHEFSQSEADDVDMDARIAVDSTNSGSLLSNSAVECEFRRCVPLSTSAAKHAKFFNQSLNRVQELTSSNKDIYLRSSN